MTNEEFWLPVVGYELAYEVSNLGRVRSRVAKRPLHILSQYKRKDGYMQVQLKINQKPKNCLVHVLVDESFNGLRVVGLEVNHIDGNKEHNALWNFERMTRKENVNHAFKTGLCSSRKGERNAFSILTAGIVASIRSEASAMKQPNGRLKRGACAELAEKYGIANSTVSGIVGGRSWVSAGASSAVKK